MKKMKRSNINQMIKTSKTPLKCTKSEKIRLMNYKITTITRHKPNT